MIKAHCHANQKMMRRASRVHLNELNKGKAAILVTFLVLCRNATQYFIDLFWQRQDFSNKLADLKTVHRGCHRFGITTRLAQALAKHAKECARSAHTRSAPKPELKRRVVTLYSH
ncbi:MAG: hypothetical protein HY314_07310 [Acidobacteria bacterium]|nr:hypothetical protein [Acidobacteriota bacterium]